MRASTFIDTNVFVYHLDAADPRKHAIAEQIVQDALRTQDACISYQVAQECLNVVCSKARVPPVARAGAGLSRHRACPADAGGRQRRAVSPRAGRPCALAIRLP